MPKQALFNIFGTIWQSFKNFICYFFWRLLLFKFVVLSSSIDLDFKSNHPLPSLKKIQQKIQQNCTLFHITKHHIIHFGLYKFCKFILTYIISIIQIITIILLCDLYALLSILLQTVKTDTDSQDNYRPLRQLQTVKTITDSYRLSLSQPHIVADY